MVCSLAGRSSEVFVYKHWNVNKVSPCARVLLAAAEHYGPVAVCVGRAESKLYSISGTNAWPRS